MKLDYIKNQIREKYDKEAEIYDDYYAKKAGKHFIKRKLETALYFRKIKNRQELLEVGSATGIFSFEYAKLGVNLVAIDLSPKNIKLAKNKNKQQCERIDFRVGDVEKLDFNNAIFDGVISFSTLRYVPNLKKALLEINRVLKPGGYIILDFPNRNCPWFKLLKKPLLRREHIHDNTYTENELIKFLLKVGFKDICFKKILFISKETPNFLLPIFKILEFIAERLPVINNTAAIIFCNAVKK